MSTKRIGILTGGGDCSGLNAVIRAVVKSAIKKHGWEVVGFRDGFRGLVENWTVGLDESSVSGILVRGGTILGTNNRANPFAYTYDAEGKTVPPTDRSAEAIRNFTDARLDALVTLGGDGSMAMTKKLMEAGVPVIGIPKTIDNDLNATDATFGFDTALSIATEAVDRIHSTAEAHQRVMIIETMGRYAGWIALRSGIAGGADVILIPEILYDAQKVVEAVLNRKKAGKTFTIVVVSEGAKNKSGEMVVQRRVEGSFDPIRLGGVSHRVAEFIERETGIETRVTILGYVQRGGTPTAYDRWLATRFGTMATELVSRGDFGKMVALRGTGITGVPLAEAVKSLRLVDPDGEEVASARSIGVSFGD